MPRPLNDLTVRHDIEGIPLGRVTRAVETGRFGRIDVDLSPEGLYLYAEGETTGRSCTWEHLYSYLEHYDSVTK